MNTQNATSPKGQSTWDTLRQPPPVGDNRSEEDVARWEELTAKVADIAKANNWSQGEVARRCGLPAASFNLWYSGKYSGRLDSQNNKIQNWLQQLEETQDLVGRIPSSPDFLTTRFAREVFETLAWAQATNDVAVITCIAGIGKTAVCRHYARVRPNVYMATMSPNTKTPYAMLIELAEELEVQEHNPARHGRAIGRKLARAGGNTLLIVDEVQNLQDDAINQLRHFSDNYQCGVALVGNSEVYTRFAQGRKNGRSYDQLKSRFGKRISREKPYPEDINMFIKAWDIEEPKAVAMLRGIARKGGALRQIDKTMKLASMLAIGDGSNLVSVEHIEQAWTNRDVEDVV
ncbi:bacteriophage DNA transposition protein B [Roseibium sp. TrichSKD4]|uniref:AAA family ATPase n=1 Tax=Roseibium sp. TrichSKD4 TaxID=744980 RepID=UPI0001E57058|nr:AAA family ATPase [Roseibium sp. TrichSKD4]EFO31645.1 bacteriophage DNA transposition protein B [Roseibium sp. TrichSKD4]